MGNTIADGVERDLSGNDEYVPGPSERDRQRSSRHESRPSVPSVNDFLPELLDVQMNLIAAQHRFLHDSDMRALAIAQRDMVTCQTSVLDRLGVFG